jgi:hypothetical protein
VVVWVGLLSLPGLLSLGLSVAKLVLVVRRAPGFDCSIRPR